MMVLLFSVIIEGARLLWAYQVAEAGIRDATRYIARRAPYNICDTAGSLSSYQSELETIVRTRLSGDIYVTLPTQQDVSFLSVLLHR